MNKVRKSIGALEERKGCKVNVTKTSSRLWRSMIVTIIVMAVFALSSTGVFAAEVDLMTPGSTATVNGAIWENLVPHTSATGTGVFDSFLRVQATGSERGHNGDQTPYFDEKDSFTDSQLLADVPTIYVGGVAYREFQLDINENDDSIYLTRFQVWVTDIQSPTGYSLASYTLPDADLVYDTAGTTLKLLYNDGSGKREYRVLVPQTKFNGKDGIFVVLFTEHNDTNDGFEEWGVEVYETGCLTIKKAFSGYPEGFTLPEVTVDVSGPNEFSTTVVLNSGNSWSVQICDLEPGLYTATERDVEGWTTVSNSGPVTVIAEQNVDLTITNTLDKGCLKIVKSFTGYPAGYPLPASVTVNITGPYGYTGSVTLNEGNGWDDIVCGLVPGDYTFSEVTVTGWTPAYNPTNRVLTVVAGTEPAAGAIGTITNTLDKGCLKIVKSFTGYPAGYPLPASVTVNITGPYGYTGSVTLNEGNGWDDIVCGLVPGDYTFSEVTVTGWTPAYNPTNRVLTVVAGTEPAAGAIGTITNTLDKGCLKIVKSFTGYPAGYPLPASVTVNITGPYGYTGSVTLNEGNGWDDIVCGLVPGDYTFSEVTVTGWTPAYNPTNRVLTVVAGTEPAAGAIGTITNTLDKGCLKIVKSFTGYPAGYPLPASVTVNITGPYGYTGSVTLNEGNGWDDIVCGLVPGDYTFSEVTVTGWTPAYNPTNRVLTVVAGTEPAAGAIGTITNTLDKGCLKIVKSFTGYPAGYPLPASVTVNITGPYGYTGSVTLNEGNGWDDIVCGLVPGDYTFSEVTVTGWTPAYNPTNRVLTVVAGTEPAAGAIGTITNTLDKGCLKIVKSFTGYPAGYPLPASVTVNITGPYGYTGSVTLNEGNGWDDIVCGLVPGDYTFSEVTVTGWTPAYNPTNRVLTVVAGTEPAAGAIGTITNTLDKGCLKIVKSFTGYPAGYPLPASVTVNITGPYGYTGSVTLNEGNGWDDIVCGLVPGDYTFSEVTVTGWTPAYNPTNRVLTVVAGTEPAAGAIGTITNTLDKGCLKIVKSFTGYPAGYPLPASVTVNITGPYGYTGSVTLNEGNGWDDIVCGLVPGDYTFSEVTVTGWTPAYNPTNRVLTVVAGTEPAAGAIGTITNTLDKGCLKIVKSFTGYPAGYPLPASVTVNITGPYGYTGSVTLNEGNGWDDIVCGLVPGDYTFSEVTVTGWTPAYNPTNRVLTVVAGTEPAAGAIGTITNTLDKGCLKIVKSFTGYPAGYPLPASVTVNITGPYGYTGSVTLNEGNGWDDIVCGLVPGDYTFSEVTVTGWTPAYNPTNRVLTVVAGTEPAAGAIGTIINTLVYHDETAWAYGGARATRFTTLADLQSNNWGWTNDIGTGDIDETWVLYAGAAQEDLTKGFDVGTLHVVRTGTTLTITFNTSFCNDLLATHLWVGKDKLPKKGKKYINSPGQLEKYIKYSFTMERVDQDTVVYTFSDVKTTDNIWIAAHADVRMYCDYPD